MFQNFQYRHIPALFVASQQWWGTVLSLISGTHSAILQYGLPARIADIPETWPVWNVGNSRTACLGILMFIFYARRQYDVLDIFLGVTGTLTLVDIIVLSLENQKPGFFRLFASGAFTVAGFIGFTQGSYVRRGGRPDQQWGWAR